MKPVAGFLGLKAIIGEVDTILPASGQQKAPATKAQGLPLW
jgi:hypothetical protein